MSCSECAIAATSSWHCYVDGCPGCTVRAIADAPGTARQAFLEAIRDEEDREAMRLALLAEYRRRKALEEATT